MKTTITLLSIIVLFALSASSIEVRWSGNVTSSEIHNLEDFTIRKSHVASWGDLLKFATYFSAYLDVQSTSTSLDIEGDAILGVISWAQLPASTFAYYEGSADVDVETAGNTNSATVDTDESAGYLVSAFLRLEERTPAGDVVETLRFKDYGWSLDNEGTGSSEGLHHATVKASTNSLLFTNAPADIYVSWLIADTYGIVEIDGDVKTFTYPKNLESTIIVKNYEYADAANNLVLVMGGCSGSVSRELNLVVAYNEIDVVSGGSDLNIVYAQEAIVDGSTGSVSIEKSWDISASDAFDGALGTFAADLNAAWNGAAECHFSEIGFAAGATEIKYDPGLSQGPLPSSAVSVLFSLMVIAFAALI